MRIRGFLFFATVALTICATSWADLTLYVSNDGDDTWTGRSAKPNAATKQGPFATLERARDEIRTLRHNNPNPPEGVTVVIEGTFFRKAAFELLGFDGGTDGHPVVYRAGKRGARFVGAVAVKETAPVTNAEALSLLGEEARAHVVQADLKALGITDLSGLKPSGQNNSTPMNATEIFFGGKRMTLARWPNDGWAKIAAVPGGQHGDRFTYEGDRPARWKNTGDVWLHGYWTYDWADNYVQVEAVLPETSEIVTKAPHGAYGYTAGKRFYALNLLEELDAPGEYFIDQARGLLFFWPPAPLEQNELLVSTLNAPLIQIHHAANIHIDGLTLESSRATAINAQGSRNIEISDCHIFNTGGDGIVLSSVTASGVTGCYIHDTGERGINLSGGDRATLSPSGNYVRDNRIERFSRVVRTYRPGVAVSGVGNCVEQNEIAHAPHCAILFFGNDNVIARNHIHDVCIDTSDAGAIYTGRDLAMRGNVLRENYLHDIGRGDVNVLYLDDLFCGTMIVQNVVVRGGRGLMVGGGRDNYVLGNVFVDCELGIWLDGRGMGWGQFWFNGKDLTLEKSVTSVNATQPPYALRYPEGVGALSDRPAAALNNHFRGNITVNCKESLNFMGEARKEDNVMEENWFEGDPGFRDAENGDLRLRPGAALKGKNVYPIPDPKQTGPRPGKNRWARE